MALITKMSPQSPVFAKDNLDTPYAVGDLAKKYVNYQYLLLIKGCLVFSACPDPLSMTHPVPVYRDLEPQRQVQILNMSRVMRFPTMWYVRPAKPRISLRIRAV